MPRSTRPTIKSKHDRAHVREQRERAIDRRFARAKRDGRLPALVELSPSLGRRHATREQHYATVLAETNRFRAQMGYGPCSDRRDALAWDENEVPVEVIRSLPASLRGVTDAWHGSPIGALADRDFLGRHTQCDCSWCCPTSSPGLRTRERAAWRRDHSDEMP